MKVPVALLAVGISATLLAVPMFLPPTVAMSSLTLPTSDSVGLVVSWSKRCYWNTCPPAWDMTLMRQSDAGYVEEAHHRRTNTRDTIHVEKPICWDARLRVDTMRASVHALGRGTIEPSNAGSARLVLRCRTATPAEQREVAAYTDSFPALNRRATLQDWAYKLPVSELALLQTEQLRAAKSRADSVQVGILFTELKVAPDSIRNFLGSILTLRIGYVTTLCTLGKNRYTGAVSVLGGDERACEAPRVRMQSEHSG